MLDSKTPRTRDRSGKFIHRIGVNVADQMRVSLHRDLTIAVPQLPLHNVGRHASVEQFAGDHVPKPVRSALRYSQRGERSL
jgi:hypothetical protein